MYGVILSDIKTVSYTHLDVYKRQIMHRIFPVKPFENRPLVLLWNADAGVSNVDLHIHFPAFHGHTDLSACRGVLHCVIQNVEQDVYKRQGIAYVSFFVDNPAYFQFLYSQSNIKIDLSLSIPDDQNMLKHRMHAYSRCMWVDDFFVFYRRIRFPITNVLKK